MSCGRVLIVKVFVRSLLSAALLTCLITCTTTNMVFARVREGHLTYSNMTIDEYDNFISETIDNNEYPWINYKIDSPKYAPRVPNEEAEYLDFSSFSEMLMALDADKIDCMELPQPVAEYFFKSRVNRGKYLPYMITRGVTYYLSMGFKDDGSSSSKNNNDSNSSSSKWLEHFNEAIKEMVKDKTLLFLKAQHVIDADENPQPIKFDKFPGAETVKIAVTGDMPPIDYVAADGTPAGFNTAMLAEIARRLKINVELISVNAGARAAALASGRVDGVFWFWYDTTTRSPRDVPKGVKLTEPYYSWDTFVFVGKK